MTAAPRMMALIAIGLAIWAPTSASAAPATAAGASERMVERINDVRASYGLAPLQRFRRLTRTARGYAGHLIRSNRFAHGSSYRRAGFRRAGEILALHHGRSLSPRVPLRIWMSSPGHRALILDRSFRYVGAAPARGTFNGSPTTIWVAHFGAR